MIFWCIIYPYQLGWCPFWVGMACHHLLTPVWSFSMFSVNSECHLSELWSASWQDVMLTSIYTRAVFYQLILSQAAPLYTSLPLLLPYFGPVSLTCWLESLPCTLIACSFLYHYGSHLPQHCYPLPKVSHGEYFNKLNDSSEFQPICILFIYIFSITIFHCIALQTCMYHFLHP